jgi:signal transduction histidine kinase
MQELIENILMLAKHGKSIGEIDSVSLDACVSKAWETVETGSASLLSQLRTLYRLTRVDYVFDAGHTTTRMGLAIVQEITDAHDWTITVTNSESGGGRFEITGVTVEDHLEKTPETNGS